MVVKSASTVGLVACVGCQNVFLREDGGGECPACGEPYGPQEGIS